MTVTMLLAHTVDAARACHPWMPLFSVQGAAVSAGPL